VVKANAYGHGAVQVARTLEAGGAEGFCVATIDEALALRAGGVRRTILVLYPVPPAWARTAASKRIAITAGDADLLEATLAAISGAEVRQPLGIQLEVETGLGRGGFAGAALTAAARRIDTAPAARLAGLWTHLQAPEDTGTTNAQVAAFEAATAELRQAGVRLPRRHVRASGSLVTEAVASYDGVRPGLSIYGLIPDELARLRDDATAARLRPALSLRARPVRVADLPAGWGISYGPTFRTSRPSRIATLPVGYGDGWARALSNKAEALVRGMRVPLVGNVAMDAVMADVTDVPGPPVTVADDFVLIGRQGTAEIAVAEVARARGTNTWEVCTAMARRLPRVYHAASGPVVVQTLVAGGHG
jgi:alanine racemase